MNFLSHEIPFKEPKIFVFRDDFRKKFQLNRALSICILLIETYYRSQWIKKE